MYTTFEKGKIYGVFGQNGSGKSTLINILLGVYPAENGHSICYNDKFLIDINMKKIRECNIGLVEQNPIFFNDTLSYNFFWKEHITKVQKKEIIDWLHFWGIEYLETYINQKMNFETLSGGEKQKLAIIRVLLKNGEVLVFDEPTTALDYKSKQRLIELLLKLREGRIIIIVSHDKEVLDICDECMELIDGGFK